MNTMELRKITVDDTDNIVKWRNTDSVKKNLFTQTELLPEQHLRWIKEKVNTGVCAQYIIVINEDGAEIDIGTVFIKNIDRKNCKGEFGIFISEVGNRGKGYRKIATQEMPKISFDELMLNRVYLSVIEDNLSAISSYEKAEFIKEGILKEDYLRSDGYVDVVIMGVTRKMWKNEQNMSGGGYCLGSIRRCTIIITYCYSTSLGEAV